MIKVLLLLALLFNITHASMIAIEDDCHNESVHEYVLEQTQASECGNRWDNFFYDTHSLGFTGVVCIVF